MALTNPGGMLTLIILFSQLLLPFPTLPLQAAEIQSDSSTEQIASPAPKQQEAEGVASYYAKRYNGRKTRSGARYNPEKLTAAHSHLPLGTRVKVVNLANMREVIVTINDRCRKRISPFIDLSRAAARKLDFLGKGTAKVTMTLLEQGDDES
jgi:rare lipoprotein A